MKAHQLVGVLALFALFLHCVVASSSDVTVNPLPKPRKIKWGTEGPIPVYPLRFEAPDDDVINKAIHRNVDLMWREQWEPVTVSVEPPQYDIQYTDEYGRNSSEGHYNNYNEMHNPCQPLTTIVVSVVDVSAPLEHKVDESYTLEITNKGTGKITAKTKWGALHALATLNQIVISDGKGGLLLEKTVFIEDAPLYPHRGFHLDTARNYYSVKSIKRTIDALAWSKMNVFHWHIVDTQSWPLVINSHPAMTRDSFGVYTQNDVKAIVQYAMDRGVRVIPEIDMPGHARAGWRQIDPSIVACGDAWWEDTAVQPTPGQLDIANDKTYTAIEDVVSDVQHMFPDQMFHAGFDELQKSCYNHSTYVAKWFEDHPGATYEDLAQYYLDKAYPIYTAKNKRIIMWEDVLLSKDFAVKHLPKDVILQSWNNGPANVKLVTQAGHDVIVSSSDFLYLDCGYGGFVGNDARYDQNVNDGTVPNNFNYGGSGGSWCAPYKTWQRMYDYDITFNLTKEESTHVLGGEALLWSEQSDEVVLDYKAWPRTAAFAESLWSGNRDEQGKKRYSEAMQRMNEFRERLVSRGIGAAPLQPRWCYTNPHKCDFKGKAGEEV